MTPSREDAATIAALEREIHRLRCELEQADARARTWRRVAQWIWTASVTSTD